MGAIELLITQIIEDVFTKLEDLFAGNALFERVISFFAAFSRD